LRRTMNPTSIFPLNPFERQFEGSVTHLEGELIMKIDSNSDADVSRHTTDATGLISKLMKLVAPQGVRK